MKFLSRRQTLGIIAGGCIGVRIKPVVAATEPRLRQIAAANKFVFGSAAATEVNKNPAYRQLYVQHAGVVTTDTALKMGAVAPKPGPKRFEEADRLLSFCTQNKIPMRGHCLVWNEWVPAWIKALSIPERRAFFDSYIEEVVTRYAGKLHSWDVVNEPFWPGHKAPGGYRLGPWYEAFGTDYIRRAFERANQADRKTTFVLNEAQTERDDDVGRAVRSGLLRLVADLKNSGIRLDVVGLQGHLQPRYPHDPERFMEFVNQLAGLGVDIYITEFDVRDDTFPDDIARRDAMVADAAEKYLNRMLQVPAVKAIITWELGDNYSFYTAAARQKNPQAIRLPRPLPFDQQLQPKPLFFAMERAFKRARKA